MMQNFGVTLVARGDYFNEWSLWSVSGLVGQM